MNRVAISFSTKDRTELSVRTVEPLRQPEKFDLFWNDGSTDKTGQALPWRYPMDITIETHVRGGADAAIVFALSQMLASSNNYTHVGLVENDVLLDVSWFDRTMELFDIGASEGLSVGAVSARCFEDRILVQRSNYAVCHNLGAGQVIFTREAAELVLANFRTGWWPTNRRIFAQLSGIDIGTYAAFRANEQWVTADWWFDATLARHGLASLALTPSPVEMIGQVPPLAEQGLTMATTEVEARRNDKAFARFAEMTFLIREGGNRRRQLPDTHFHRADDGTITIFPHQIFELGGTYSGDWRLKWAQGFGPFAWRAGQFMDEDVKDIEIPKLTLPISGPCSFLVSGGETGGTVEIHDYVSGYRANPSLPPEGAQTQVLNVMVPAGVSYRDITLTALTPGTVFYGIQCREPQPRLPSARFDWSVLPPV